MSRMTAKEVHNELSNFVNNFNCDEQGFVDAVLSDHRTLQRSTVRLFMKVIEAFAELPATQTDARNEASVAVAKEIVENFKKDHAGNKPSQYLRMI